MENNDKKEEHKAGSNEIIDLIKDFFKLQNQYNHFRIEEYKEWNEKECDCPICVDYTVHLCEDKIPEFCEGFREEWS